MNKKCKNCPRRKELGMTAIDIVFIIAAALIQFLLYYFIFLS